MATTTGCQKSIPDRLEQLVARFQEHADTFHVGRYTETQLRREFIDPLFKLLGWDVDNEHGYAETYKDVIHEDAIKIGGFTKAPDYCFRIGGARKFFVEAKKPSVDIKGDPAAAYQLRRYAWSAKLALSILTDFEELAVYDCRLKPNKSDKASVARVLYLRCDEYPSQWDKLASIFSREAVLKGSFDKYAESSKKKRGTAEVDDAFLSEIENWRGVLARTLALRNPGLSQRDLNFAVQRTIDRIIFLRICEDRGIEEYGALLSLVNGQRVYQRLFERFRRADERYNSGLFHFSTERGQATSPDNLTPSLIIDDKPLKDILNRLYYPESPYEFSVLPADILGQVYERFLGKVIRLTKGHQAKVEEKPEVRKAGGVYYTPTHVVNHIIEQTVGRFVKRKTPQQIGGLTSKWRPSTAKKVAAFTILDPACGSGSFLLCAYQSLLDWYRDWYVEDGPARHCTGKQPRLFQHASGEWRLTTSERKRILLTHIYGVDIDPQAVEVTKLSLLLKVLEGENEQTLASQLRLFHERALPDLGNNIKCGNSLISPDFYDQQQSDMFESDDVYRINPFDWQIEFSQIMSSGGFDTVIGNPPWGQKAISDDAVVKQYIREHYQSAKGIYDLFRAFVERGVRLTKENGFFGMVLPDIVLLKDYPETRRFLLDHLSLHTIDWWGMAFKSAVIDATTITGRKSTPSKEQQVQVSVHDPEAPLHHSVPQANFWKNPRQTFNLFLTPERQARLKQMDGSPKLEDFFEVHEGVHSGNIRQELFVEHRVDDTCYPLLFGRGEIAPYLVRWEGKYIRLAAVPKRRTRQRYANLGKPEWHQRKKVLVRRTGDYVLAAVDHEGRYASNNFFVVFPRQPCSLDLDGLCALLNTKLLTWYFRTIEPRRGRVFAELKIKHLNTFPLPPQALTPNGCQTLNELGAQRRILADQINQSSPSDEQVRKRMADHLDEKIQALVCNLFEIDADFVSDDSTSEEKLDA